MTGQLSASKMHEWDPSCSLVAVPETLYGAKAELMQCRTHRNPFGKAISKRKLFFCQLRYELSSQHQWD